MKLVIQRVKTMWTVFSENGSTSGNYWQVVGSHYCSHWFDTYELARDHLEKKVDNYLEANGYEY